MITIKVRGKNLSVTGIETKAKVGQIADIKKPLNKRVERARMKRREEWSKRGEWNRE